MGLEELIYDEEEEFERIVDKVKKIVRVRKDGRPILVQKEKLTKAEQVACYLIGKFFAKILNLTEKESATVKEIANELKLDPRIVSARLKDLTDGGLIERVGRGEYKILTIKLEEFVDKILDKIENK